MLRVCLYPPARMEELGTALPGAPMLRGAWRGQLNLAIQPAMWPQSKVVIITSEASLGTQFPFKHSSDPMWPKKLGLGPVGLETCRWYSGERWQIWELWHLGALWAATLSS